MTNGRVTVVADSSLISSYVYYDNGNFNVKFVDGSRYCYKDVDQKTIDGLEDAESKGAYFVKHIKYKFETEKLDSASFSFPTGPRPEDIPTESFESLVEWTPEEEDEFFRIIDDDKKPV